MENFPPVLVRLLARHPDGNAMTDEELRALSGLRLCDVRWISLLTSWEGVEAQDMRAFVKACGVDFGSREQMRAANRYVNTNPKFRHLQRDKNFPAYREMLRTYYDSQT